MVNALLEECDDMGIDDTVINLFAIPAGLDDMLLAQTAQMMGNC